MKKEPRAMKANVSFQGRKAGAIGVFQRFSLRQIEVAGLDDDAVRAAVYELGYEHVHQIHATEAKALGEGRTLFDEMQARGVETDHHETDLYVPATDETAAVLASWGVSAEPFLSHLDSRRWLDVPFMYSPAWERKQRSGR